MSLLKAGKLENASKAYKKILPLKKIGIIKFLNMSVNISRLNQDFKKGQEILEEGIKNYPKKVSLRLEILNIIFVAVMLRTLKELGYVRRLDAGKSPYYYSFIFRKYGFKKHSKSE